MAYVQRARHTRRQLNAERGLHRVELPVWEAAGFPLGAPNSRAAGSKGLGEFGQRRGWNGNGRLQAGGAPSNVGEWGIFLYGGPAIT